jgi:Tol biopolymer transport system component
MGSYMNRISVASIVLVLIGCDRNITPSMTLSENVIVYSDTAMFVSTMNADGSNKKRLFGTVQALIPKWSPNGTQVAAYSWDKGSQDSWLTVFDVGSGNVRNLAFVKGFTDFGILTFSWSADGKALVFNRSKRWLSDSQVGIVDNDGKSVTQLTSSGYNFDPIWSPDMRQIAYLVIESNVTYCRIMNVDGTDNRPAPYRSQGLVKHMAWSPDARSVAIEGPPDSASIETGARDLFLADRWDNKVKRVTFDGLSGAPSWSPDGSAIAFVSGRDVTMDGYVMNRDGGGQRRLTNHGKVSGGPLLWSPDGTKLLYAIMSESRGGRSIAVVNSDGSNDTNLREPAVNGFSWKRK